MDDEDFERYRGGANQAVARRVHVTISPARLILLNRRMYELMGKPEAVYLSFSRGSGTIMIEPASPGSDDAFPVVANPKNFRINAAPFCRYFNIKVDKQMKFAHPNLVGDKLYLSLSDTVCVSLSKPRRRPS